MKPPLFGRRAASTMKRKILICSVLLAVFAASAIWSVGKWRGLSGRPLSLILISLDTLRADRIGAYGYDRNTTPEIDSASKDGIVFERAVAASSWTIPSHMSMFSGLYPSSHGAVTVQVKVAADIPLVAELLHAQGYRTFAFTGGGNLSRRHGFHRGFDVFRKKELHRPSGVRGIEGSVRNLIDAVGGLRESEPFFAFLHTYDIHCPYTSPEPFLSMFQTEGGAERSGRTDCGKKPGERQEVTEEEASFISNRYDGAVRWVDSGLGRLFSFLKSEGRLDRTVVVLLSDHGEEFLEHGAVGHQGSLHFELVHTPLIILAPGFTPGRVGAPVSHVDILPTLLDLLDIPKPEGIQGRSFVPLMRGRESGVRECFSELHRAGHLRSVYSHPYHLIVNTDSGARMCFNVEKDPAGKRDLKDDSRCVELEERLRIFFEQLPVRSGKGAAAPIKKEAEKLKSLGYL